jgi:Na+-transporting NADH:ubiquinone oxidoreductase subunit NqrF
MNAKIEQELNTFIKEWKGTPEKNNNKTTFLRFKEQLSVKNGVTLDFISRPGVTYSLRAKHTDQKNKDLFVMVDVIDDAERWLSICFYNDMISDPDERGDLVPAGLLGEDAICFDLQEQNESLVAYIEDRLDEACGNCT